MSKERIIDINDLARGLRVLEDGTKAPLGSARVMNDMWITDRGGLARRPGMELFGANDTSAQPNVGFTVYKKADAADTQIMLKARNGDLMYYDVSTAAWNVLLGDFTVGSDFDFEPSIFNLEFDDYLYGGNRTEPYFRWQGQITHANGAYAGGAGTLTVDSVFTPEVLFALPYDFNGSAVTNADIDGGGTTITNMPAGLFVDDQWNGLYIHVLTGAFAGQIRQITDCVASPPVITFNTFGGNSAGITFEIRRLAFPTTGTLATGTAGGQLTYTGVPTSTTFTISAGAAVADNAPVTTTPTFYFGAPRGNRLASLYSRMYVGNVRSGVGYNSGGTLQAAQSEGSLFMSKVLNPTDFTFSASRTAGQGDIVPTDSGGVIRDTITQQDGVYFGKEHAIGVLSYTQDTSDLAQKQFKKGGVGLANKFTKGKDDVYFMTPQNEFTSLGRVPGADSNEQVVNIGLPIKRLLDTYGVDKNAGYEWKDRVLMSVKRTPSSAFNDVTFVWNKRTGNFEGEWDVGFFGFEERDGELYGAEASSANVYRLFTEDTDIVKGTTRLPMTCRWLSNWFNLTSSKFNDQEIDSFAIEGYIKGNTSLNFELYKDYNAAPFFTFSFAGTEDGLLDGVPTASYLGEFPLGLEPQGAIGDTVDDLGRRHFMFIIYFPQTQARVYSIGTNNTGTGQDFEIIRYGLNVTESTTFNLSKVKSS